MLPKTAEYALRAVVCLGCNPTVTESADQLAEQTKIPRRYLHKVLQDLVRAKLVRSQSGPGGGYALALAPKNISILDVVNAVGPLERIRHCPLGLSSHKRALSAACGVGPRLRGDRSGALAGNHR